MPTISCLIQVDSAADARRSDLESRLRAHHSEHFPADTVRVSFRAAAGGFMFTEGRQSTSSVISCQLDASTTRDFREQYMRGICDLWMDLTDCTEHEIVVSISEITQPAKD